MFWKSMWPFLYTHPIKHAFETFFRTGVDKVSSVTAFEIVPRPRHGANRKIVSKNGKSFQEWYALEKQEIHPSKVLLFKNEYEDVEDHAPVLKDTCDCLQLDVGGDHTSCHITNETLTDNDTVAYTHHLFSCEIRMSGDFVLYFFTKEPPNGRFTVALLALDKREKIKILCNSEEKENVANVSCNSRLVEMSPVREGALFDKIYVKKLKEDWKLR